MLRELIFMNFNKQTKVLRAAAYMIMAKLKVQHAFSRSSKPPILVYQMGKVGSGTIHKSLINNNISNSVLHLHFLNRYILKQSRGPKLYGIYPQPYHVYLGIATRKALNKHLNYPIKIISLVRDPIAIKISSIFQNPHIARMSISTSDGVIDPQKAIKYFESELKEPHTFDYISNWFDNELKTVFDIDVFASPFPTKTGYAIYSKGMVEALVIRLEDLSEKGPKVITDFLGLEKQLDLKQSNVRSESKEANAYREVLDSISLSTPLCKEIYSSKFVNHFYNDTEINKFISRWTKSNIR